MEKFAIVFVAIFLMFFLVGHIARKNATVVAGVEMLGYFDDPKYDPSEEVFFSTLKRLEEVRLLSNGWVLGVSASLVVMTSGILTPINETPQVMSACLWVLACVNFVLVLLFLIEQILINKLRKKLVGRYAIKLANPQY